MSAPLHGFVAWPKTPRLNRQITVTEKIDGTNAAVIVRPLEMDLGLYADEVQVDVGCGYAVSSQSRNRMLSATKTGDNAGFGAWVRENAATLAVGLGPGRHFGEWWGLGIQRGYGQARKLFSLFNPFVFGEPEFVPAELHDIGVRTVPLLLQWGEFSSTKIGTEVERLRTLGSVAAPGFMQAEGVIVRHSASGQVYKQLIENDDTPKSAVAS